MCESLDWWKGGIASLVRYHDMLNHLLPPSISSPSDHLNPSPFNSSQSKRPQTLNSYGHKPPKPHRSLREVEQTVRMGRDELVNGRDRVRSGKDNIWNRRRKWLFLVWLMGTKTSIGGDAVFWLLTLFGWAWAWHHTPSKLLRNFAEPYETLRKWSVECLVQTFKIPLGDDADGPYLSFLPHLVSPKAWHQT